MLYLWATVWATFFRGYCVMGYDSYYERMIVNSATGYQTSVNYVFTFLKSSRNANVYETWPKVFATLLDRYSFHELFLSLTQGSWKQDYPYAPLFGSGPAGAQVVAWFDEEQRNVSNNLWRDLIHSLSGTFCASLTRMYPAMSSKPAYSFPTQSVLWSKFQKEKKLFPIYGEIPNDFVCTENLTPFRKLLPCKSDDVGIAGFFDISDILSSNYVHLSLHYRKNSAALGDSSLGAAEELILSLRVLYPFSIGMFDIRRLKIPLDNCAVANSTQIYVEVSDDFAGSQQQSEKPNAVSAPFGNERRYIVLESVREFLDLAKNISKLANVTRYDSRRSVTLHNYFAGSGQQSGKIVSTVVNHDAKPLRVLYTHLIPCFLSMYFHTMKLVCSSLGGDVEQFVGVAQGASAKVVEFDFMNLVPGLNRERPNLLELVFVLPAQSSCTLSIEFDKALLRWTEYPPDANHGFYIPAPSLTFKLPMKNFTDDLYCETGGTSCTARVFGDVLLIRLPTPDFSMPYNVICLVSTVVALAFGPIYNLATKSFVFRTKSEMQQRGARAKLSKLCKKFYDWLCSKVGERVAKLIVKGVAAAIVACIAYWWEDVYAFGEYVYKKLS